MDTAAVLADTDHAWRIVRSHIDGLTDEELVWEPVNGCWRFGDWSADPPDAPFTTIGWRLAHIGQSLAFHSGRLFAPRFASGAADAVAYLNNVLEGARLAAGTAAGARGFVDSAYAEWRGGIESCGDTMDDRLASDVRSFNLHSIGHATEIGTIRHLYRWTNPLDADPFVDACMRGNLDRIVALRDERPARDDLVLLAARMGRWHVIPALLDLGVAVDGGEGATALHHAAAYGPLSVVEMLVERGADLGRRDPQFDATPQGWAEYYGVTATAEYLKRCSAP